MSRLQEHYKKTVAPALMKKLNLKNPMEVPKISKITVNMGVGEAVADRKVMEKATADLARLSGQKALVTRARKSVAASRFVMATRLARKSRCGASACTSFWTAW